MTMKKERPLLQGFKKERLILMETLKSFSFITTLPFSASTSPHRLLLQLNKKDANTNISHHKYMFFDTVFDCMLSIFEFDLGMKPKNNVQFEIARCLKLFDLFEETKMILEEFEHKNLNVYNFIDGTSEVLELEKSILQEITELRTKVNSANASESDKIALDAKMSAALGSIMIAVENYPELKANENVMHLQRSLNEVEEQISAARRAYNQAVTDYNNALEQIPTNFMATAMHYTKKELFEISQNERKNVNVKELFN